MHRLVRPSYAQGFARSPGQSLHPSLWHGLVGAWFPAFGPTGLKLFDVSGRHDDGTLTNMDPASDWIVAPGGGALDFDGSDDHVEFGSLPTSELSDRFTIVARIYPTAAGSYPAIVGRSNLFNEPNSKWMIYLFNSVRELAFAMGGTFTAGASNLAVPLNEWSNVAARSAPGVNITLNLGASKYVHSAGVGTPTYSTETLKLGAWVGGVAGHMPGRIACVVVWDGYMLNDDQLAQVFADPLGMFRLRPTARRYVSAPAVGNAMPMAMDHYRRRRAG